MTNLVHNERIKLSARFLCNIGVWTLLIGVIAPMIGRHDPVALIYAGGWAVAGIICLAAGVWLVGRMR